MHDSYQGWIEAVKSQNFNSQMVAKIESLNKLLALRDRELQSLKSQCKGGLQELQKQYQKLQRQLAREQKRRQKLGVSNKSLGAYKGHFYRAQKKIAILKDHMWEGVN